VLGWLCEYAVSLREECPLDFSDWKVNQVQEEDLQSLRVLRELCRTPGSLDGFGFSVGDFPHDQLVRRPVVFALPLCMNFRGEGVVCWLLADGEHLVEPNENMVVGVRIMRTDSVTTEKAQRSFPTEGLPKIKICSDWPGIDLYSPAQSFTWSGPDDWGVELQSQPPAGDE
jgi:hypothetical protein